MTDRIELLKDMQRLTGLWIGKVYLLPGDPWPDGLTGYEPVRQMTRRERRLLTGKRRKL